MFRQADIESATGFYKESNETRQKASAILENNSKIQTRNANMEIKMYKDVGNLLDAVHDKQSWDDLRAMFPVLHPDEAKLPGVAKILQMEYNPKVVDSIRTSMTSQKERAQTLAALADAKARTATAAKDEAYTRDYLPKLEELAEARAKNLGKAGGTGMKVSATDVNQAAKMILDAYPDADPNKASNLARHLAQDALIIQTRDGVDKATAQDRAFKQAGRAYFAGIRSPRNVPGSTPQTPLALPKSKEEMKDGMYYMTPKNGLQVWDSQAGGFVPPSDEAIRAQGEETDILPVGDEGASDE
jgi:hypothetical protein